MSVVDSRGVHRADTTKGPPLRILSLDGGGVRGYSMFILLEELMHRTYVEIHGTAPKRSEIPKPCDHFDLIVGTGTGGLIAIMLGRLRLDLATCKDVYVRMTRRVFETDKTFAGIPYRSTLFKASKMEEAIMECVAEHTVFDDEGNDTLATAQDIRSPVTPGTPMSGFSTTSVNRPQRSMSQSSRFSASGSAHMKAMTNSGRWGNPHALLYDVREGRTKTAITAVYRGTRRGQPPALLRTYDSRKDPPPEFEATIWQAGRATTAIGLAFKPIQIGQSIFTDEGAGRFNPSPEALDEAAVNEWPGRDVGVFVSIGTGKRPNGTNNQQQQWWESFLGGAVGDFAEARRRLFQKIEGCEETHQYMVREHLAKRGVSTDNYYRFNVEVGVGEFGMNEWNRLTDISTNTKMYLSRSEVQNMNHTASNKLARIHKAKTRWERALNPNANVLRHSWEEPLDDSLLRPSNPSAIEMPGNNSYTPSQASRPQSGHVSPPAQHSQPIPDDKVFVAHPPGRTNSDNLPEVVDQNTQSFQRPQPPHRGSGGQDKIVVSSASRPSVDNSSPPPLPPKTPIGGRDDSNGQHSPPLPPRTQPLPYPDNDGPPPVANMARKPQWS